MQENAHIQDLICKLIKQERKFEYLKNSEQL